MAGAPERVVLDTNVLLSAVLFGGRPQELVDAARLGRMQTVTSLYILQELQRVLTTPRFGVSVATAEQLAVEIAAFMEVVPVGPSACRWTDDPEDDPVVETALQGRCGLIVTGDRHLLQATVPSAEVIIVAEMVARIGEGRSLS